MVPFKLEAQVSSSEAAFTPWKPNPCCNSLMEVFIRTSCDLIDFFFVMLLSGEWRKRRSFRTMLKRDTKL